jgi:hypothetical protein
MWFVELGSPWPKHGCFDDEAGAANLRRRLLETDTPLFGVVIETVITKAGASGRIVVRCSDGSMIDDEFTTTLDLVALVGRLVMVECAKDGKTRLVPVHVPIPLIPHVRRPA